MTRSALFAVAIAIAACSPSAPPPPEPTTTPESTATPEPTATPDANVLNEAYIEWASGALTGMGDLISGLAPMFAELEANPALIGDPDYATRIGTQLGKIRGTANLVQEYDDVPPDAEPVHAKMVQFAANMATMTDLYAKGLDNMDVEAITQAAGLLNSGSPIVKEITAGLVALRTGQ